MISDQIVFNDGAAYERFMGQWSQRAGALFLDWLEPKADLRWLDVGCGNGAFTQVIVDRCEPRSVDGVDPSEAQISHAQKRFALTGVQCRLGDATSLPFPPESFDIAVMPLVIFFVPDPLKGVTEMARVVCGGGLVTAYAWDMLNGGFPYDTLYSEIRKLGISVPEAPSVAASQMSFLRHLWTEAELESIETCEITVERTFANFDDYWSTVQMGSTVAPRLAAMKPEDRTSLQSRMRQLLTADENGAIRYTARANAIRGSVKN